MKVLIRQFLGQNHSWSVVGWGIAKALLKQGHQVDLFATDGIKHIPEELKSRVIGYTELNGKQIFGRLPDSEYDSQISYTAMSNFQRYLSNGKKNRFGIWAWEWAGKNSLPSGFARNYHYTDLILAPSNFVKQSFMDSGIPESKIKVIPHGIDAEQYNKTSTITLPTNKKCKILANIAQNHIRKNIPGLLEAYGKAFTNKDDVCLILKGKIKPLKYAFDISLNDCIKKFKEQFPNHAEFKLYSEFLPDISDLYRSIDIVYTTAFCEGFYMPSLEALASGKLNIAPRYGGQLDFLNDDNSLLIDGKKERAEPKSMYWDKKHNAIWFRPNIDDAVEKLRFAVKNYETFNIKLEQQKHNILKQYNWDNIVKQIMELCQ